MNKNWTIVSLGEIAFSTKGKKPKRLETDKFENSIPYLDIKAFEKKEIRQYAERKSSRIVESNDIVMVWDGARSGWVSIGMGGALGSTLAVIYAPTINKEYLYKFLQSQFVKLNTETKGTGIPHVNPDVLWNIQIPLPPLNEQKRIANKLDQAFQHIDSLQNRLNSIPELLKQFRKMILQKLVNEDYPNNDIDWEGYRAYISKLKNQRIEVCKSKKEKENINNEFEPVLLTANKNRIVNIKAELICDFITKGTTPKKQNISDKGDIPYLKVYNIVNNQIDFDYKPQFVNFETHNNFLKRSRVFPGDILMNIVGPPLCKVALVPDSHKEWNINQALAIFRPIKGIVNKYLYYSLSEGSQIQSIELDKRGTAGQINLSLAQCRELKIKLFPQEIQNEISLKIKSLLELADQIESKFNKTKQQLDTLPQQLLTKAFRGELVAQDPNDEPAEKLLEQIKQEIKNLKPTKKKRK